MPKPPKKIDTSRLGAHRICVDCVAPRFGDNYKPGYLGFTHSDKRLVSAGIAHFTRWSRMSDIHVSHVLVVTGENEAVEAVTDKGVIKIPLTKYFEDSHTQIFFRKPKKLNPDLGARIASTALAQVGARYDHLLLAAQVLEGSFLRRWIYSAFREAPDHFVGRLLNRDDRWICSELAAYCLDAQPEYADKGVLAKPHYSTDPQELFEDQELFAAWKQEPPAKKPKRAKVAAVAELAEVGAQPVPQPPPSEPKQFQSP